MKNLVFLVLLLSTLVFGFAGVAGAEDGNFESKARANKQTFTVEQICSTFRLSGFDWSHDGKWFAYSTDSNGTFNLFIVAANGGEPRLLTNLHERAINPTFSWDGKWVAFQSDTNGNSLFDLFLVSFDGGEPKNVTNTPNFDEQSPSFSPDGTWLSFISNAPATNLPNATNNSNSSNNNNNPNGNNSNASTLNNSNSLTSYQIGVRNLKDNTTKFLTHSANSNYNPIWSYDGTYLGYTRTNDFADSNVYAYDFKKSQEFCLTQHQGEKFYWATAWSPDGKKLLATSNAFNGFENVAFLPFPSGELTWLTNGTTPCYSGSFNHDGSFATWTQNNEGSTTLFVRNCTTNKTESLNLATGFNSHPFFSWCDNRLAFLHESATTPCDIWTYDFGKTNNASQVSFSIPKNFSSADLSEPFLVHYASFDGKQISAYLYLPFNLKKDGSNPAVVFAHSGLSAGNPWNWSNQFTNGYNSLIQYFVNNGFTVLAPNYRGSTGFGKSFEDLDNNDWGNGNLQDLVFGTKFLSATGYVHPNRIALLGESYGGYLALQGLTRTPDVWAAGVDFYGFSNLNTYFHNAPATFQPFFAHEMGNFDQKDAQTFFSNHSPLPLAANLKAPLLILHGNNDGFVPFSESSQFADAIKANHGNVEFHNYANDGHFFSRTQNRLDAFQQAATFLAKYLRPNQE
ncbi:MAG: S9 family peptidase [Planctomycetes bacterium]|nr:S9 family peptidase [Planctomycetota bacterium]MBI3846455.1 S9 family peptidase [Planctomycetota bacterium]